MTDLLQDLPDPDTLGRGLMDRLDGLAAISESPDALTRRVATPEHRRAAELIMGWMAAAGMTARIDDVGNVVGRYEGAAPDAPALLMGSHQDTVVDAGRYDGMLGIVVPLACVQHLHEIGVRLPFALEVVAFCDEEGVRYGTTLLGSRALAGSFDMGVLDACDAQGVSLRQALRDFGCDPDRIPGLARDPKALLGFVETHIEQGPVLEDAGLPLGVVSAFAGCTRLAVDVKGEAGHAGTVPMDRRRDALAGAAEAVAGIEALARATGGAVVATVGRLSVQPGAINVIPGRVRFTVDLRSPDDAARSAVLAQIRDRLAEIAGRRGIAIGVETIYAVAARSCDSGLRSRLERAVADEGIPVQTVFSGAGHDAMAMAEVTPAAMLFVRCVRGISHSPLESIDGRDAGAAVRVLLRLLQGLESEAASRRPCAAR